MSKGERTRQRIVEAAAELFNAQGFSGVSIADVAKSAELEKGSLYNHFSGKEELALASLEYAFSLFREQLDIELREARTARDRIEAVIRIYVRIVEDPFIAGGCPMMNAAVDSDDTQPALRDAAAAALTRLTRFVRRAFADGIRDGEFTADTDCDAQSKYIVASMEGGVMLSELYGDAGHAKTVASLNRQILDRLSIPS